VATRIINAVTVGRLVIVLVVLVVWQWAGSQSAQLSFFFGTPLLIIGEFVKLLVREDLHTHLLVTAGEAVTGLAIGTLLGAVAGLALWYSKVAAEIARPFVLGLGTMPVIAFAPVMIVWFGIGFEMKVALAALATVFPTFAQTYRGAVLVSRDYVEVLIGMNASRHQIFTKVIVPGSLDWVFSSMRLNIGLGLLGAFMGEFISAERGLGFLVLKAASLYNVPRVFAAATGIIILAIAFDWCGNKIEQHSDLVIQMLSVPIRIWKKKLRSCLQRWLSKTGLADK